MNIDSNEVDRQLNNLEEEIGGVTAQKSGFKFKFFYVYIIIPIAVLILLGIWNPSFLRVEELTDEGTVEKLSIRKLIMWGLIIGVIIDIGLFTWRYKRKK